MVQALLRRGRLGRRTPVIPLSGFPSCRGIVKPERLIDQLPDKDIETGAILATNQVKVILHQLVIVLNHQKDLGPDMAQEPVEAFLHKGFRSQRPIFRQCPTPSQAVACGVPQGSRGSSIVTILSIASLFLFIALHPFRISSSYTMLV